MFVRDARAIEVTKYYSFTVIALHKSVNVQANFRVYAIFVYILIR